MEIALLVVLTLALITCVGLLFKLTKTLRGLVGQVDALEGQVLRMSVQLQEQEERWVAMDEPEVVESGGTGLVPVMARMAGIEGKLTLSSAVLIGFRLLAAYLQRRAARAARK